MFCCFVVLTCSPLLVTHSFEEDPVVAKERERLLKVGVVLWNDDQKFGAKRLRRIVKRYFAKKHEKELKEREAWLKEEFRLWIVCCELYVEEIV